MSASRSSVAHNHFRPSLRILFTGFWETKPQLWKLMSAISGCCIGSSGSPLHPPLQMKIQISSTIRWCRHGIREFKNSGFLIACKTFILIIVGSMLRMFLSILILISNWNKESHGLQAFALWELFYLRFRGSRFRVNSYHWLKSVIVLEGFV